MTASCPRSIQYSAASFAVVNCSLDMTRSAGSIETTVSVVAAVSVVVVAAGDSVAVVFLTIALFSAEPSIVDATLCCCFCIRLIFLLSRWNKTVSPNGRGSLTSLWSVTAIVTAMPVVALLGSVKAGLLSVLSEIFFEEDFFLLALPLLDGEAAAVVVEDEVLCCRVRMAPHQPPAENQSPDRTYAHTVKRVVVNML